MQRESTARRVPLARGLPVTVACDGQATCLRRRQVHRARGRHHHGRRRARAMTSAALRGSLRQTSPSSRLRARAAGGPAPGSAPRRSRSSGTPAPPRRRSARGSRVGTRQRMLVLGADPIEPAGAPEPPAGEPQQRVPVLVLEEAARAPGRSTRRTSAAAAGTSTWCSTHLPTARVEGLGGQRGLLGGGDQEGRLIAPPRDARASSTMPGETSTAVSRAPRRRSSSERSPAPQPSSRTDCALDRAERVEQDSVVSVRRARRARRGLRVVERALALPTSRLRPRGTPRSA